MTLPEWEGVDALRLRLQLRTTIAAMVIILMDVSGSGKSTVGRQLARMLSGVFQDGDWFHSSANLAKMRAGELLTDEDRQPWLESLAHAMDRLAHPRSNVRTSHKRHASNSRVRA